MVNRIKRAGLDYWNYVAVKVYDSWQVRSNSAAQHHIASRKAAWYAHYQIVDGL